jgi:dolichol-phosphate mannosyltransferase
VHRTGRRGFGRSLLDGLSRAIQGPADFVFQMDADLSHDPKYLAEMMAAASDADLVIGSRYLHGVSVVNWPLRRIILSAFANQYVRAVTRLSVRDCTSGFRCWRREALARLPMGRLESEGYSLLVEMLYLAERSGCRIVESPIIFVERRQGVSKMSSRVMVESALTPWRLLVRR